MVCLHSAPGGGTTLYLPEDATLHDLVYGETLAASGFGARFSMPPRGTRLLFYGAGPEAIRFGAEPETAPPGLTREESPQPAAFVFEAPAAAVDEVVLEDEALFVAALESEPIADKDESAPAPVEAEPEEEGGRPRRRRRRRRGGGGDSAQDTGPETGDNASDEPAAEAAPTRPLPSLQELLPDSEAPVDGELPPIPAEFLPLDEAAAERPAPRRRRRRPGGAEPAAE